AGGGDGGIGRRHRRAQPGQPFHHHRARGVLQGFGPGRPVGRAAAADGRRTGADRAERGLPEETGEIAMRVATIWRLGVKELRGLRRTPALLALIAAAFSIQIYAAATATPFALNEAPISIVDEDVSPLSARIGAAFQLPYFTPP